MKKILFFIETFTYRGSIGGAEKVLVTLLNQIDTKKFDVTVQTLYPDEYAKLLNGNIKYKYCYAKKSKFNKIRSRVGALTGLTYKLHIKDNYDIEVAFLEYLSTKIMSFSTNKKAKKVAWVHCDFNVAVSDKLSFVNKTKKQYKNFDKIVCVSEQCKSSFDELFGNMFDSIVIHNVVDDNEILSKANLPISNGLKKEKFTMCSVARFSPQKKISRLLSACYRLHNDGFDFDMWLIGDGTLRNEIEQYIIKHKMSDYFHLLGFQPNPYPYMMISDLLVCSSIYEGFSTFVTEALILGKATVVTDVSGMRELLGDSEYGIITKNDDEDFYLGLKRVLSNPNLIEKYESKAKERGKMFQKQKLVLDVEDFLLSL